MEQGVIKNSILDDRLFISRDKKQHQEGKDPIRLMGISTINILY